MYHRSNVLVNSLDILRCIAEYHSLVVQDLFFEQNTHLIKNLIGKRIEKGARALKMGRILFPKKVCNFHKTINVLLKKLNVLKLTFLCQVSPSVFRVSFKISNYISKTPTFISFPLYLLNDFHKLIKKGLKKKKNQKVGMGCN